MLSGDLINDVPRRLVGLDCGRVLPFQQHAYPIETEQIAAFERAGALAHLLHFHSPRIRRADERAYAGAGDHRRLSTWSDRA